MATPKTQAIRISDQSKGIVDALKDRYGIDRSSIADRLLSWFSKQPEETQSAILMALPETMQSDFAAFALQRMTERLQLDGHTTAGQIRPTNSAGPSRTPAAAKSGHPHSGKKP